MALALHSASLSYAGAVVSCPTRAAAPAMETLDDLKDLAKSCNPSIGFYDPPLRGDQRLGEQGVATIGGCATPRSSTAASRWRRSSASASSRTASSSRGPHRHGIRLPRSPPPGPGDQWDALPTSAKLQILGFVGFLKMLSETSYFLEEAGEKHYVMGGKPGFYRPSGHLAAAPGPARPLGSVRLHQEDDSVRTPRTE